MGQPSPALCFQGPDRSRSPRAGLSGKKAKAQELGDQPVDRPQEAPWAYFCDFQDITHVVLREHHASIHCQDKCLVGPEAGAGLRAGWGAAPGYDTCLISPWPLGADPAFPGHRPVLGVTGGWLLPPDGRLKPLPVPRGGSSTAGDEYPGRHPRTPAVSAQEGGCAAWAMVVAAANETLSSGDWGAQMRCVHMLVCSRVCVRLCAAVCACICVSACEHTCAHIRV